MTTPILVPRSSTSGVTEDQMHVYVSNQLQRNLGNYLPLSGGDISGNLEVDGTVQNTPLAANKAIVTDASSKLTHSSVDATTLTYLDATSSVQSQLNDIAAGVTAVSSSLSGYLPTSGGTLYGNLMFDGPSSNQALLVGSAALGTVMTVNTNTADVAISGTLNGHDASYYDPSSSIQTQLNGKLATPPYNVLDDGSGDLSVAQDITVTRNCYVMGSIRTDSLSTDIVVCTNSGSQLISGGVSKTTLGYLDATSSVQTQLNGKASKSGYTNNALIKANGSGNITSSSILSDNGTTITCSGPLSMTGNMVPTAENKYSIGDSSHVFNTVYAQNIFANSHNLQLNSSTATTFNLNSGSYVFNFSSSPALSVTSTYIQVPNEGKYQANGNVWVNSGSGGIVKLAQNGTSIVQIDTNMYPAVDNAVSLGYNGSNRWSNIYSVNAVTVGSDRNIKTDIADSDLGLDFVNALRPVSYKFIPSLSNSGRTHYGLIAQEVEAVLTANNKTSHEFSGLCKDKDSDEVEHYSLRYDDFISPMIKAIQQLSTTVTAQQAQITALQTQLDNIVHS